MIKLILLTLLLGISACGSDSNSSSSTTSTATIEGTAAEGLAIEGAVVTFTDKDGNTITPEAEVITDAFGNYSASFEGTFLVPLVISITTPDGTLKSIIDDENQTTANINPVTNFVADKVIDEVGLDNVASGTFAQEGKTVVEAAFGEGVDFNAFSSEEFIAQNANNTSEPTPADVILDALAEGGEESGIDTLLNEAITDSKPLLDTIEFQLNVAKAASNVSLSEPLSSLMTTANETTGDALSLIETITTVIDDKKSSIEGDLVDSGLTDEEQEVVIDELVDMASEFVKSSNDDTSATTIEQLFDTTDELFTEQLTNAVQNSDESLSNTELAQVIENVSNQIVIIIEDSDIDLVSSEPITLPSDIITVIDRTVETPEVITNTSNWNIANWGELEWQ